MRREGIEKVKGELEAWNRNGKAESLERPGVQNRTAHRARRFYALLADWCTNSIVDRGRSPAPIRRRART